jgi:hypothetical protein
MRSRPHRQGRWRFSERKSLQSMETTATRYSFRYSALSSVPRACRKLLVYWRRGSGSNRRIKVLQTSPLPLGYRAPGLHTSPIQR